MLATLAVCQPTEAKRKSKKNKNAIAALVKDSVNADYKKVTKNAAVQKGLFTTLYNAKEGKLYFEIPDSAFGRTYILANRVAATSNTRDFVAGQIATQPLLIRFSKDERNVYIHQIQSSDIVAGTDPIESAFDKNFYDPVLKGFKIAAQNGKNVVIDVTAFFGANEKAISPIKTDNPLSKLLGGANSLKGTFVPDASGIVSSKCFPENIEIKSRLSFTLTPLGQPYSVIMHRSLFALPDDPMPMRLQDNRVGFFYSDKSIYTSEQDRLIRRTFIHRWRLEPKKEDLDKYFQGELVEPQKPIVFYVDSAFPEKWRTAIHQGTQLSRPPVSKTPSKLWIILKTTRTSTRTTCVTVASNTLQQPQPTPWDPAMWTRVRAKSLPVTSFGTTTSFLCSTTGVSYRQER